MKKLGILFMCTVFCVINYVNAQSKAAFSQNSGSKLSQIAITKDNMNWIKFKDNVKIDALTFFQDYKSAFGLGDDDNMQVYKTETDKLGFTHYRYQQFYKNVPVEGAEYLIHLQEGIAKTGNGKLVKGINMSVVPVITKDMARTLAISYVHADKYMWQNDKAESILKKNKKNPDATYYPTPKLVIMDKKYSCIGSNYRLAYKVDIYAQTPLSRQYIYVDAMTGKVFHTLNRLQNVDVKGVAVTKYSGTQNIITDSISTNQYLLKEYSRGNGIETYDMNEDTDQGNAVDFTDTDNYWNNVNAQQDEIATDAHWGAEMVYDYYLLKHGRNSYNDSGAVLVSYVHYDTSYANAFWDGQSMTYGDGDGTQLSAMTSLDICAHEITHGVTEYSANLIYQSESGALNESFSDIFGEVIEAFADSTIPDWKMGKNVDIQNGVGFRSMSNPKSHQNPDTYYGQYWDEDEEVHTNSGVGNYWFYLLSIGGNGTNDTGNYYNVSGIGVDSAAYIAYRMLTVYLTPSSDYFDAYQASVLAAEDLYGACSKAVLETANAWYAVGVGMPVIENDIYLIDITSPVTACGLSNAENVTVVLKNNSCNATLNAGDTIFTYYRLDGGATVQDTLILANTLNPFDTLAYTYNTPVDASTLGIHSLDCWIKFALDTFAFDDTIKNYTFESILQQNIDVGIVNIASPIGGSCSTSDIDSIKITLQFYGCDSLATNDSIVVAYRINGGSTERDTIILDSALYSYEMLDYTFKTPPASFISGNNTFDCWSEFDIDTINDNDSILGFPFCIPYPLGNNIITFEDTANVVDSFYVLKSTYAKAYISKYAAGTGVFGFQMTGGDLVTDKKITNSFLYNILSSDADTVMPDSSNIWDIGMQTKICFCVDATTWNTANLSFNLKQTYSSLWDVYSLGFPPSNFRVMVNDTTQIGKTYYPNTNMSDPYAWHSANLDNYAGTNFELCFEAITIMSYSSDAFGSKGDNALIDNIYIGEAQSIKENETNLKKVKIFPNPSNGVINLEIANSDKKEFYVEITNINGQVIYNNLLTKTTYKQIDLTNYPKGMYFIKVQSDNIIEVGKIVLQ